MSTDPKASPDGEEACAVWARTLQLIDAGSYRDIVPWASPSAVPCPAAAFDARLPLSTLCRGRAYRSVTPASRIAVIAFGLCFPILVNTAEGVRGIPLEVRDTASMLHVGRVERASRIYLPAALPSIMAGLRIAVSLGLVLVIVSEFVGEQNGIGYYLIIKQSEFDYPALYAGILFLGLLGYVLNRLFLLVERRVLAWHYRAAGE
jgi:ABC-type nitrate/sulfonate/bicarbonate transport system permease component